MKKTLILDSVGLISGFGDAVIEPVETMKKVKIKIIDDPEFIKIKDFKAVCDEFSKKSNESRKQCSISARLNKQEDAKKHYDDFLSFQETIKSTMEEMKPVIKKLVENEKKLIRSEAIYMEPKKNEVIVEDDDENSIYNGLVEKIKNLPKGTRLDVDGKEVFDNRGFRGYKKTAGKWSLVEINKIGVNVGTAKLSGVLTNAEKTEMTNQFEATRVTKLDASAKLAEKAIMLAGVSRMSASKRSELEIQGQSPEDALTQATTWYDAEVVIVEAKYA